MAEDFSDQNKDYGLPKVDPQPIKRDQLKTEVHAPMVPEQPPEKKDNKLIIIVLSIVGLLALASLLYVIFDGDETNQELPQTTTTDNPVVPDPVEETEMQDEEGVADTDSGTAETLLIEEEPGSIQTISQRTNRYYIFLGSYKFHAYAQRHAEELAKDGFAVKLISPDDWVGLRVAVGNYANIEEAQIDAQQIRSRYDIQAVISKY
jgi:hypothetical protein